MLRINSVGSAAIRANTELALKVWLDLADKDKKLPINLRVWRRPTRHSEFVWLVIILCNFPPSQEAHLARAVARHFNALRRRATHRGRVDIVQLQSQSADSFEQIVREFFRILIDRSSQAPAGDYSRFAWLADGIAELLKKGDLHGYNLLASTVTAIIGKQPYPWFDRLMESDAVDAVIVENWETSGRLPYPLRTFKWPAGARAVEFLSGSQLAPDAYRKRVANLGLSPHDKTPMVTSFKWLPGRKPELVVRSQNTERPVVVPVPDLPCP